MVTSTITLQGRIAVEPNVMENVPELVILTNRRGKDETGSGPTPTRHGSWSRRSKTSRTRPPCWPSETN